MLIREVRKEDEEQVQKISLEKFGESFLEEVEETTKQIFLVVEIDDQIVAYGTAGPCEKEEYPELEEFITEKTGMLNSVAVLTKYERRGIASSLAEARLKKLKEQGYKNILSTAWRNTEGVVHVGKILDRLGFKPKKELIKYWEGLDCVYCEGYCVCDAVLYELKF